MFWFLAHLLHKLGGVAVVFGRPRGHFPGVGLKQRVYRRVPKL
jgi:hypothetical protein